DTIADMGVSADYHQTLQDEISRARRYNHALSALLLEVDEFHRINEELSRKTGDEILSVVVKIVTKSIRTVDKLARFSGDQFLIILPNTNQREAFELAERIRQNIYKRTARMHNLPRGITVTLSVRQYGGDEKASGLISDLERILRIGKQRGRDSVYAREDITASTIG
ncbi:MAG: GGDEF domain-containing protein, partial [Chitinivibrionales bacterium]